MPSKESEQEDAVHLAAAKYANDWDNASIAYRKQKNYQPFNLFVTQDMWVAHYEGFKAGFAHAK